MTATMTATIQSPGARQRPGHDNERLELPMSMQANSLRDRFFVKVDVPQDKLACWTWTGATAGAREPYGRIWNGRRSASGNAIPDAAHRVSYEMFVGEIPDGYEIDHLCRNTLCVNPLHLEAVTRLENQRRGFSPMQEQRQRMQCPLGHRLDTDNTYVWRGMRRCRECNRIKAAEYRKRRRSS